MAFNIVKFSTFIILIYIGINFITMGSTEKYSDFIEDYMTNEIDETQAKIYERILEEKIQNTHFITTQHLVLGKLQLLISEKSKKETEIFRIKSRESLIKSTNTIPTNAQQWALLGFIEKEDKKKLNYYIEKSLKLGKYDEDNQRTLIGIVLSEWEHLNEKNIKNSKEMLRHTLLYFKNGLITLKSAVKKDKVNIIQDMLKENWHLHNLKKFINEQNSKKRT